MWVKYKIPRIKKIRAYSNMNAAEMPIVDGHVLFSSTFVSILLYLLIDDKQETRLYFYVCRIVNRTYDAVRCSSFLWFIDVTFYGIWTCDILKPFCFTGTENNRFLWQKNMKYYDTVWKNNNKVVWRAFHNWLPISYCSHLNS